MAEAEQGTAKERYKFALWQGAPVDAPFDISDSDRKEVLREVGLLGDEPEVEPKREEVRPESDVVFDKSEIDETVEKQGSSNEDEGDKVSVKASDPADVQHTEEMFGNE